MEAVFGERPLSGGRRSLPPEFLLDNFEATRKFVLDSGPHVRFGLHDVK
jgi:hypothetical protein